MAISSLVKSQRAAHGVVVGTMAYSKHKVTASNAGEDYYGC